MAILIRFEEAVEQRLERLARETGRTKSYYLRELVMRGLDDLEEAYLAEATLERVRKDEEAIYSAADVWKALDL